MIDRGIGPDLQPYAFFYLDDIIIVTETFDEHLVMLEYVLVRIKDAGLNHDQPRKISWHPRKSERF